MGAGPIITGGNTFINIKPGLYVNEATPIGAASDEIRFSAVTANNKSKASTSSITRVKSKDFTAPGAAIPTRELAVATFSLTIPKNGAFTLVESMLLVSDMIALMTTGVFNLLFRGKSDIT